MIDQLFETRVTSLVALQKIEREKRVLAQLGQIDAQCVSRGMYHSSVRVQLIEKELQQELSKSVGLIWDEILKVQSSLSRPITEESRSSLKHLIQKHASQVFEELTDVLITRTASSGAGLKVSLDGAMQAELLKRDVEVDLYVDAYSNQPNSDANKAASYHFYGAVGAVLTGANSTANTTQNIAISEKDALLNALKEVRTALALATEIQERSKKELIEITDDCLIQVNNAEPNGTKLAGLLGVLATAIQSIASAEPAYEVLKSAASLIGLDL